MKLIVMSDSHGRDKAVKEVIRANLDADYFIHCGDLCSDKSAFPNLILVRGNCDWDFEMPIELIRRFNGVSFYITHGHRFNSQDRQGQLATLAKWKRCKYVLYGHTHVPSDLTLKGIRLLNPGSLYYNRNGAELGYLEIQIDDQKNVTVIRKELNETGRNE